MTYEEFQNLPKRVKAAMLWAKHEQERHDEKDVSKMCVSYKEMMEFPDPPEWVNEETEEDYRRGFQHGVNYAADIVSEMGRKGFVRPQEIANIINDFDFNVLLPWRHSAIRDVRSGDDSKTCGHPFLKQEHWKIIRNRIFERDKNRCRKCGSDKRLCVDHIEPVCQGGLPKDDNLQTLCTRCNGRKSGN